MCNTTRIWFLLHTPQLLLTNACTPVGGVHCFWKLYCGVFNVIDVFVMSSIYLSCHRCICHVIDVFVMASMYLSCHRCICHVIDVFVMSSMYLSCHRCICHVIDVFVISYVYRVYQIIQRGQNDWNTIIDHSPQHCN